MTISWRDYGLPIIFLAILFVAGIGVALGHFLFAPDLQPEVVTATPPVRQADRSLIAERMPATVKQAGPAPHLIPKGDIEERRGHVTVKPAPGKPAQAGTQLADCDPVTIDYSLVREKDGGRRVIVSSPSGEVVGAVDVPIVPDSVPGPARVWSAGVMYEPRGKRYGAIVTRDVGRARLGAAVLSPARGGPELWITAGIAF